MEAKTVHTATPWEQDGLSILKRNGLGEVIHVAEVRDTSPLLADGEAKANAAFIVRACNSHQALIEALKPAIALIAEVASIRAINTDSLILCADIVKCGRDALAVAEQS